MFVDLFTPDPDRLTDREREQARWHPEKETLALAAAGAALVLGEQHSATKTFAKAPMPRRPVRGLERRALHGPPIGLKRSHRIMFN